VGKKTLSKNQANPSPYPLPLKESVRSIAYEGGRVGNKTNSKKRGEPPLIPPPKKKVLPLKLPVPPPLLKGD
jgi:hypothetical protein